MLFFILNILSIHVRSQDVLVRRYEEPGGAARGVQHNLVLLRVHHLDDKVDDVARGAELSGVALRAQDGQQVLKGVAQTLGVVVTELVNDFQERAQRLGVAIG